jgi:hypothetical protein
MDFKPLGLLEGRRKNRRKIDEEGRRGRRLQMAAEGVGLRGCTRANPCLPRWAETFTVS